MLLEVIATAIGQTKRDPAGMQNRRDFSRRAPGDLKGIVQLRLYTTREKCYSSGVFEEFNNVAEGRASSWFVMPTCLNQLTKGAQLCQGL